MQVGTQVVPPVALGAVLRDLRATTRRRSSLAADRIPRLSLRGHSL